jgi:flagellar L-ring protein FlgH
MSRHILNALLLSTTVTALTGCTAVTRLEEIGSTPGLAHMADASSPVTAPAPAVPLPAPPPQQTTNSLWVVGSRSFFHDPRASRPGDIITVNVTVADVAKLSNTTTRTRTNSDDANLTNFFGVEGEIANVLPGADPASLVKMGSDTSNVGAGAINRSETISLTLAALVTQVLPNGNMVIQGTQEIKTNDDIRQLTVAGVVRPEDISSSNTIFSSQIAEARINYGGRGDIASVQKTPAGTALLQRFWPF